LLRPLRVPAFRRLWTSQLVSEVGDWSARLVLSLVVYTRSGSVVLTGLVTTVLLIPWLGPGQLLTGLLEQWPRRRVMVAADLVRAAAFLVALPPGAAAAGARRRGGGRPRRRVRAVEQTVKSARLVVESRRRVVNR